MIIRNVHQLLENLTEVESKIQKVEKILESCGVDIDREKLLLWIITRKRAEALLRDKNLD
jgi:hypothetical protein